jgi:tetratricopeptide (TPR) repeat protein
MPLKICVYAISKNEEKFVRRFCAAAKDADMILVADTGSTDSTVEELRAVNRASKNHAHGYIHVENITISPWRFDLARNAALALIPPDVDVCVSLDLDEELQPGWREEIERVWKKGETTRLRYLFDWGAGIAFYYEKIHARAGYRWHHPCHEYPVPDVRLTEVWAQSDKLLVIHKPDPTKSRAQYLDLLKVSVIEDPHDPRNAFYYARELSFNSRWEESIAECRRYLALPGATWINERCYAYRVIGRCYNALNNLWEAEKAFHLAAAEAPQTREPWFELASLMYTQMRWAECLAYAMRCLSIVDREKVYTVDPTVWGPQTHDYAAIAAYRLGIKPLALEHARKAVALGPGEARYAANLRFCEEMP